MKPLKYVLSDKNSALKFHFKKLSYRANKLYDKMVFFPAVYFSSFCTSKRDSHHWNKKNNICCVLAQRHLSSLVSTKIFFANKLWLPLGKFQTKAKENATFFQSLLHKDETILDMFYCHSFDEIESPIETFDCALHFFYLFNKETKNIQRKGKSNCFRSPHSLPPIQQLGRRKENSTLFSIISSSILRKRYWITND